MNNKVQPTLHLATGRGAPYSRESIKCAHCGLGLAFGDDEFRRAHHRTKDPATFTNPPEGLTACNTIALKGGAA